MREQRVGWAFNSSWGHRTGQCRKGDSHNRTCTDLKAVAGSGPVVSCYWLKFQAFLPKQTLETPKLLWMRSGTELSYWVWCWQSHRRARSHSIPFAKGSAAHVVAESLDETMGRERNRRQGPSWTLVSFYDPRNESAVSPRQRPTVPKFQAPAGPDSCDKALLRAIWEYRDLR